MEEHHFYASLSWLGGRNSSGYLEAGHLKTDISIPKVMDGPDIGTNPDEMLLGAAATCYIISLAALIERMEIPLEKMDLQSEAIVEYVKGIITFKKIIHRPVISLKEDRTERQIELLKRLVVKAEESCMISRALANNVEITLEPVIK